MRLLLPLLLISSLFAQPGTHPDSITFGEMNWEIPDGSKYRSTVNGAPFYYAKENLPLFSLSFRFKAGEIYGQGENGVGTLYQYALENGGTAEKSPNELDSIFSLYAIDLSVGTSNSGTSITISGLADEFPRAMDLLEELLETPGFDTTRMERDKAVLKQRIAHRFDNPGPLMKATALKLVYPGSVLADLLTDDEVDAVTRDDMKKYHSLIMNESPVIVAFAGSIDEKQVKKAVKSLLPRSRKVNEPVLNEPKIAPTHKVLLVQKPINQAYIIMGQPLFKRPSKKYYPLTLFNEILGGGGFNSRLVTTVRSDAGLTYSINSAISAGYLYEGTFSASLFTKSESVNHALKLTLETIRSTINEDLSSAEINEKKVQFVSSLPSSFRTGSDIVATYQSNEAMGRAIDHYRKYPAALEAISKEEVLRTTRDLIKPDDFYMVIVGDTTELLNAPAWEGFSLKDLNPTILTEEEVLLFNTELPKAEEKLKKE